MTYILAILSLAAFATAILLAKGIYHTIRAKNWPKHTAKILYSNLTRRTARMGPQYYVHVRYEYSVGSLRTGTCVLPSFLGTSRGDYTKRLLYHFREGANLSVSVDPLHPERAVLIPSSENREWALLGLMIFVASGAMWAAFRI